MKALIPVIILVFIIITYRVVKAIVKKHNTEGFRTVRVSLSEDYDTDLIRYLNEVENKSEFFKRAARAFIEKQAYKD